MSLIEDAIKAHEKNVLENKEEEEKAIEKFIEDGIGTIKQKFGDSLKIDVEREKEGDVVFLVDGLRMKVRKHQGYFNVYLVQTCPMCHEEYAEAIITLKDIGKLLKNGHSPYDCEKVLKAKAPVKELTTDEKLLEALRDFVYENLPEQ